MRSLTEVVSSALYGLRYPGVLRLSSQLSKRQWWDSEDLYRYGDGLTRALAVHSANHVPYYRQLFDTLKLDPATIDLDHDWELLSVLTKETLRTRFQDLTPDTHHAAKSRVNYSGGSTGTPVRFLTDLALYDLMEAFFRLIFSWAGWRPGEMVLHLWGGKNSEPALNGWNFLRSRLRDRAIISFYTYDENSFTRWWKIVNTYRPAIIYAYPSVAADFSNWLEQKGYRPVGVKGVFCSAETLFPKHREIIERVFSCKVYNQYGSRETPCVACECPEGNMHLFVDLNRVEFLDQPGDISGLKRIVVTPLYNFAQPLLRYDSGDLGLPKPGACPCGRGYPIMEMNLGRQNDHLLTPDGRQIYPSFFHHLLDGKEWIRCFQFRQTKIDKIELSLETDWGPVNDGRLKDLKTELLPSLNELMGGSINLDIQAVSTIERTAAGKHRFVLNELMGRK